ncbi:hypothetical protein FKP32DRAFT_1598742 [Trametes sanguinea]|nr:hypothetical protein FKP32DRAFT_1598742 [Trametes sanguinea]
MQQNIVRREAQPSVAWLGRRVASADPTTRTLGNPGRCPSVRPFVPDLSLRVSGPWWSVRGTPAILLFLSCVHLAIVSASVPFLPSAARSLRLVRRSACSCCQHSTTLSAPLYHAPTTPSRRP